MVDRISRNGVMDFLLFRRDHARENATRFAGMPELMAQRHLTKAEEAVYWQAYYSGLMEGYENARREVSMMEVRNDAS
jgi:hypothetical protein